MLLRNYAGDTFREGRVSFLKRAFTFPRVAFLSKLELHFLQKNFLRGNAGARKYAKLYRHNSKFVKVQSETYRWFAIAGGM